MTANLCCLESVSLEGAYSSCVLYHTIPYPTHNHLRYIVCVRLSATTHSDSIVRQDATTVATILAWKTLWYCGDSLGGVFAQRVSPVVLVGDD